MITHRYNDDEIDWIEWTSPGKITYRAGYSSRRNLRVQRKDGDRWVPEIGARGLVFEGLKHYIEQREKDEEFIRQIQNDNGDMSNWADFVRCPQCNHLSPPDYACYKCGWGS